VRIEARQACLGRKAGLIEKGIFLKVTIYMTPKAPIRQIGAFLMAQGI